LLVLVQVDVVFAGVDYDGALEGAARSL